MSPLAISYFQQAANCFQQAEYVDSIQHYLSGLRHDTSQYHIYADLAKAYEMVGNWEQALCYLDIALQLCPDSPTVLRRKARIIEEKDYYQTLIRQCNLVDAIPSDFTSTLQSANFPRPQNEIVRLFFKLTVEPAPTTKTLWYICQLIEKTNNEISGQLNFFPDKQVSISLTNTHNASAVTRLPKWAGGCYDGHIHVNYCADGDPELGVLYALIRHEWTHLLVDLLTHGNCPIWLDEGLAQTIARPLLNFEKMSLQRESQNGTLPTLDDLNQPFINFSPSKRKIAYLQSAAIVSRLIDAGGYTAIRKLLSLLGTGTPVETALRQIYKKSIIPK